LAGEGGAAAAVPHPHRLELGVEDQPGVELDAVGAKPTSGCLQDLK
jgi:hypothetical protein